MDNSKNNVFQRYVLIGVFLFTSLFLSYAIAADDYEPDDIYTEANEIQIEIEIQEHNFHDAGDEDWNKFNIPTNYMTVDILVNNPGSNCDAVIELYDSNGTTRIFTHNETEKGVGEEFRWSFIEGGDYYIRVRQFDSNVFGDQTNYDFSILETVAGFLGFITGMVTSSITGDPISGALIKTDNDVTAGSLPNGAYLILHQPGTFTITGEAPGYGVRSYPDVVIVEADTITHNISLIPLNIDSDGDGIDDHEDNCPVIFNPDQKNFDGDGSGDMCDNCPQDRKKTEPGACGCGVADTDTDGDGISDCIDGDNEDESGGVGRGGDCFISTMKE
ncbi:carboxypeptidase-like regulatory domain-containing protein [Thermodesulfobacteriota bacterium]